MSIRVFILSVAGLLSFEGLRAQTTAPADSTLRGNTTIEVIQSYKPELKQVKKPEFQPELPLRDTSRPAMRYEVPQQSLYYTYSSLPLRPLSLGKDSSGVPYQGYLKLGGGNLSTIFGEAGIANLRGANYETAIRLHHLSQQGDIKNQKTSLSGLEAEGELRAANHFFNLSVKGLRNEYYDYGYDHDVFNYGANEVKTVYSGGGGTIEMRNETQNSLGIDYRPSVSIFGYSNNAFNSERSFGFNLPVSKDIDTSLRAEIGINGNFTRLKMPVGDINNNVVQITPGIAYHSGTLSGKLGLYPTFGTGKNNWLLPDINIWLKLPGDKVIVGGGWQALLRQNTFYQLSTVNPFLFDNYITKQTRSDEVYGSVKAGIGNHVTLSARISWWQFNELPLFLNDTLDNKNFYLVYDGQVNMFSVQGSIRYQVGETFSAGLQLGVFNYYQSTQKRVWHEPGLKIKGDLLWRPIPALMLTGYVNIMDQIYALNRYHAEEKLDVIFDIGGGAEYSFIPRLSAFLNINNLLNNKYERWLGYESYGFNAYGGLRLKF
jgi:hypothetical protein